MAWGEYPAEYNVRVHGTYDPARFYGKPDTAFGQVKLAELPGWLSRRHKSPMAMGQACGRAWWRWNHKYIFPLKAGIAGHAQIVCGAMVFFYLINITKYRKHKFYKYH